MPYNVADAGVAGQTQHVTMTKHVPHETVALALLQTILAPGHDAGGILPPMLQYG
jgi:hypothetical protein